MISFTLAFGDFLLYVIPFLSDLAKTEVAEAAVGDFSIFEESTGGQTVDSTGVPLDMTWDTTIATNSNIGLQGNNHDVELTEGGKYFVSYSAWTYEGTAGGTNRRGFESYLSLNGTPLSYGRGSGYMRDSEGDTSSYANGSAIIEANPGDDLKLAIQRSDANTTAGSQVQPSVNGLQILKLPATADYVRLRRTTDSGNISGVTSFASLSWNQADEVDNDSFAFSPVSANITLKGNDEKAFLVTLNLGLEDTSGGSSRQNYEVRLALDGTELPGTRTTTYIRGSDGHYTGYLVFSGLITKTSSSDQDLSVQIRRESTGSATTILPANQSAISIMAIPDTAELISVTDDSGLQTTSLSASDMTFNSTDVLTSPSFTHSTSTNPERIIVETPGDYLFFATAYSETTVSGNNTQPFRINWKENGIVKNRGGFGAYNRANTTFTSGASGAIILPGLSASDYVGIEHIDETSSAPVDNTFAPDRVALQGVLLNANFYGVSVTVTDLGTQTGTIDVDSTEQYIGGAIVLTEETSSRNVTNIILSESGSIDAESAIQNVKLFYDLDTTSPYDCESESYSVTDNQYGFTDINGFSGGDGVSSFSDAVGISTTATLCVPSNGYNQ